MDSLENLRVLAGSKDFFRVCNTSITSSNLVGASYKKHPEYLFPGVFVKGYKKSCRWQPLVYYFIIIEFSLTYDRRILLHAPHPDHPDE